MSEMIGMIFNPPADQLEAITDNIAKLRGETNSQFQAFQLASALVSHTNKKLVAEGVSLMEMVAFQQWQLIEKERLKSGGPAKDDMNLLHETYFYIAIGQTKLREYHKAQSSVAKMLQFSPNHPQGLALSKYIDNAIWKEGVVGLTGLVAASAVAVAVTCFFRAKK